MYFTPHQYWQTRASAPTASCIPSFTRGGWPGLSSGTSSNLRPGAKAGDGDEVYLGKRSFDAMGISPATQYFHRMRVRVLYSIKTKIKTSLGQVQQEQNKRRPDRLSQDRNWPSNLIDLIKRRGGVSLNSPTQLLFTHQNPTRPCFSSDRGKSEAENQAFLQNQVGLAFRKVSKK